MKFNVSKQKIAYEFMCAVGKILLNVYRYTDFNEEFDTFEGFVEALERIEYKKFIERSKVKYDNS